MEKASEYAAANLINKQLGGYNNYNIPADKLISADGKVDASARLLYHDNWGDALFRTGLKQDYMLSMSGGSDKTTYYLSLGWLDEEGIMTVRTISVSRQERILTVSLPTGSIWREIWGIPMTRAIR